MKARACLGNYTTNAYYFDRLEIPVCCVEELAYCLKENAFLLGTEIMNDGLLHFIGNECQIPELARELYPLVHQKGSLSAFVTTILNYVGFFDAKEVKGIEDTVREGSGLTDYQKQKLQIDYMAERKKYPAALTAYEELITAMEAEGTESPEEREVLADLYYNRAVVYTRMLLYRQAAGSFQRSYDLKKDKSAMQGFLLAKRMELSEQEYVDLVARYPQCHDISLQAEKQLEALEQQWKESPKCMGLEHMRQWRAAGENRRYYEESEQIVEALKEEYRG